MEEFSPAPTDIARRIVDYFRAHGRDLPWRQVSDSYAIWVSEIMLQQTRVATVIPYWTRWLERFPSATALADAPLDDVLSVWSGLGYYSRARNLHKGAREVVARYGGQLPRKAAELRTLPGIGRYTAGAIASIAYGEREPLVDGNVARVFARVYEIEDDIRSTGATKLLWRIAEQAVPADAPGDFNQGLMELGATLCTPVNPNCHACPVQKLCKARASGRQHELPIMPRRKKADQKPLIDVQAVWIERDLSVLMGRRPTGGLYGGMWELPQAASVADLGDELDTELVVGDAEHAAEHEQELSHRRLRIRLWPASLGRGSHANLAASRYDSMRWYPLDEINNLALSSATRKLVAKYRNHRARQEK